MRKALGKLGIIFLLIFSIAGTALADSQQPELSLTSITSGTTTILFTQNGDTQVTDPYLQPNSTLETRFYTAGDTFYVDRLPANFSINGTFSSPALNDLTLYVNGAPVTEPINLNNNETNGMFSLPWSVTSAGNYSLKVTAKHGNQYGEAAAEVLLEVNVTVDYKAAPAIAAEILKDNGVKPNNKAYKNYISQVALHMGKGASFEQGGTTYQKTDEGYRQAVYCFLKDLGAVN